MWRAPEVKDDYGCQIWKMELVNITIKDHGPSRTNLQPNLCRKRHCPLHQFQSKIAQSIVLVRLQKTLSYPTHDGTKADPMHEYEASALGCCVGGKIGESDLSNRAVVLVNNAGFALAQSCQSFASVRSPPYFSS